MQSKQSIAGGSSIPPAQKPPPKRSDKELARELRLAEDLAQGNPAKVTKKLYDLIHSPLRAVARDFAASRDVAERERLHQHRLALVTCLIRAEANVLLSGPAETLIKDREAKIDAPLRGIEEKLRADRMLWKGDDASFAAKNAALIAHRDTMTAFARQADVKLQPAPAPAPAKAATKAATLAKPASDPRFYEAGKKAGLFASRLWNSVRDTAMDIRGKAKTMLTHEKIEVASMGVATAAVAGAMLVGGVQNFLTKSFNIPAAQVPVPVATLDTSVQTPQQTPLQAVAAVTVAVAQPKVSSGMSSTPKNGLRSFDGVQLRSFGASPEKTIIHAQRTEPRGASAPRQRRQAAGASYYQGAIAEIKPGQLHPGLVKRMGKNQNVASYVSYAISEANKAGIDGIMFVNQLFHESGFNPKAVSNKGARGIAQFMPLHEGNYGLTGLKDFFDPYKSIDAGIKFMREKTDRYKDQRLALVAYNGGDEAIEHVEARLGKSQITYEDWHGYMERLRVTRPTGRKSAWQNETFNYINLIAGRPSSTGRVHHVAYTMPATPAVPAARAEAAFNAQAHAPAGGSVTPVSYQAPSGEPAQPRIGIGEAEREQARLWVRQQQEAAEPQPAL